MLPFFKFKKALQQAKDYVDEVNSINEELTSISNEQLIIIEKLNADNASLRIALQKEKEKNKILLASQKN